METRVFNGVVGSYLYGCANSDSDYDTFEVYVEDAEDMLLNGGTSNKHVENAAANTDIVSMGFRKVVLNLRDGGPNVLPLLWNEQSEREWQWWYLVRRREMFVTQKALKSLLGAALHSQETFHRKAAVDGLTDKVLKEASTALRWLNEAIDLDTDKSLTYPLRQEVLDDFVAIRSGALSYDEISIMLAELDAKAVWHYDRSLLPEFCGDIGPLLKEVYMETWLQDERF